MLEIGCGEGRDAKAIIPIMANILLLYLLEIAHEKILSLIYVTIIKKVSWKLKK